MKIKLLTLISVLLISSATFSQQEKGIYGVDDWTDIWTDFKPEDTEYRAPTQILSGVIKSDTKLSKRETYLLSGNVFVKDSTTLTIEPGTVILGDYKTKGSLIISNGSKIIAKGTQTDPIIFSSNRPVKKIGDWGGIIILGDAPVNKKGTSWQLEYGLKPSYPETISYGGLNPKSDSGILQHVRIEYAGKRTKEYGYHNGLLLAGVGDRTILENIMVSYSAGNSLYIIGGKPFIHKFVSFRSKRKDIIIEDGAQTTLINSLVIKSPYFTATGGGSSVHLSNFSSIDEFDPSKKATHLEASNISLLVLSDDLKSAIDVGLVNEALYVEKGATFEFEKSVFSGFNPAVILDNTISINNETLDKMKFTNMYFNNCNGNIFVEENSNNEDLEHWYGNAVFQNVYSKGDDVETFIDSENLRNPDFRLRINKIIAITLPDDDE